MSDYWDYYGGPGALWHVLYQQHCFFVFFCRKYNAIFAELEN